MPENQENKLYIPSASNLFQQMGAGCTLGVAGGALGGPGGSVAGCALGATAAGVSTMISDAHQIKQSIPKQSEPQSFKTDRNMAVPRNTNFA